MTVTATESKVVQRFKKSAIAATTITLIPSTAHESEARPTHLAATECRLTYTATPENLFGVVAASLGLEDEQEYLVTIERVS